MYLEEIILDGFKSYANRTVISGFDSKFNAITGLNGSGKSNILDAICFVLGITNLSQVCFFLVTGYYVLGPCKESTGISVQTRPGGHHESNSNVSIQQRAQ